MQTPHQMARMSEPAGRMVADYLAALVDLQIVAGVDLAVHYYRLGQPGRGGYELARLAMRVNRLLATRPGETRGTA